MKSQGLNFQRQTKQISFIGPGCEKSSAVVVRVSLETSATDIGLRQRLEDDETKIRLLERDEERFVLAGTLETLQIVGVKISLEKSAAEVTFEKNRRSSEHNNPSSLQDNRDLRSSLPQQSYWRTKSENIPRNICSAAWRKPA